METVGTHAVNGTVGSDSVLDAHTVALRELVIEVRRLNETIAALTANVGKGNPLLAKLLGIK